MGNSLRVRKGAGNRIARRYALSGKGRSAVTSALFLSGVPVLEPVVLLLTWSSLLNGEISTKLTNASGAAPDIISIPYISRNEYFTSHANGIEGRKDISTPGAVLQPATRMHMPTFQPSQNSITKQEINYSMI